MYSTLYPNVEAELARARISKAELGDALELSRQALYNRLSGKTKLSISDARAIRAFLETKTGRPLSLKYLFNLND